MLISDKKIGILVRLLLFLIPIMWVEGMKGSRIAGISRAEADSLGRETVIYDGLPVTFNSLSRDFLKKIYGKENYRGLSAEQTVASIRLYPVEWKDEPLILVEDESLRRKIGASKRHISLSSLFNEDGSYRVAPLYSAAGPEETRVIEELDERVGILLGIISGELIVKDDTVRLPEWRVNLEIFYNRIPFLKIIFIMLFAGFGIGMGCFLYEKICGHDLSIPLQKINAIFLCVAFALSLVNFIFEWILAGRIPLSNMGETLSFTGLVGISLTLLHIGVNCYRSHINSLNVNGLCTVAMLFWGCVSLVSWMLGENPVVTPLMPALQSPWLSIHVTLVMVSYSLLALTFIMAIIGVGSVKTGDNLRKESIIILRTGVSFLIAGIVTGSIWAKDAWGSYWSWDPKETWALVTLIAYAIPCVVKLRCHWLYLYLLFAFLTILMTYFGVNYLLGGKHSYV